MARAKIKIFEDVQAEIDSILASKRSFWNLNSISHVDFDDICQIIRVHIFTKFDQWNQDLPFTPWANKTVSRQIINLKKKYYGRLAPPCQGCQFNMGGGQCSFTKSGSKSSECPDYAKWEITKGVGYKLLLAESTDKAYDSDPDGESQITLESNNSPDYAAASDRLHQLVMAGLPAKMQKLYRWLYIEHRSDEFISQAMNFKTSEEGKLPGYRQITNIKRVLIGRAKEIIKEIDIFE